MVELSEGSKGFLGELVTFPVFGFELPGGLGFGFGDKFSALGPEFVGLVSGGFGFGFNLEKLGIK